MEAIELRKKTDEFEISVKKLLQKFINDVGICDVKINVETTFIENYKGEKSLVNTSVKVYVTV